MDFGVLGFDGLVGGCGSVVAAATAAVPSDAGTNQKLHGSELFGKQASFGNDEDVSWRSSKMAKSDDDLSASKNKSMLSMLRSTSSSLFSAGCNDQEQQILTFSCPKSQPQNSTLPWFQLTSSSANSRTAGCNNINGLWSGFTPSQWIELEHQALIYKYISANMPIPTQLLLPIRKAFESVGFSGLSGGSLRSSTLGWGAFHLGFSNSIDPEPGRCRRTDGKKWRCSRDAVTDQKYCERHMNRGRHRSRKPVEGRVSGHSSATKTTSKTTSYNTAVVGGAGGGGSASSRGLTVARETFKSLQSGSSANLASSAQPTINRMFLSKENAGDKLQDTSSLCKLTSTSINLNSKENEFLTSNQQSLCEETSENKFGLVSTDSLINPSHKEPSTLMCLMDQATEPQHPLLQSMDSWLRNEPDSSSMSISSDFFSSTSTNSEKVTLSPLRLSHEACPIQMGLGVGTWVPTSWESSVGGPLGEALHSSSQSSPTGVLQRTTFVSMSNSSG